MESTQWRTLYTEHDPVCWAVTGSQARDGALSPLFCVGGSGPVIKHLPGDQAQVRQYDQVEEEDTDNSLSDDLVMRGAGGAGEGGVVGSGAGLG